MNSISIATNVTSQDLLRIFNVLPNWLKIFGKHILEIVIVYDKRPVEGRIKELHKSAQNIRPIKHSFDDLLKLDPRIRITNLDYKVTKEISGKWFKKNANPIRCQMGTPIYAFIYAIEETISDIVLKVDCDMVFYNNGFIEKLSNNELIKEWDIIEISRTGSTRIQDYKFSTRAFFLNKNSFYKKLPIPAYKLDFIRQFHRKLINRSDYLALEQMIQIEIEKKNIQRSFLDKNLGCCMHICTQEEMQLAEINLIIEMFGKGIIPENQLNDTENFSYKLWESALR